MDRKSFVLGWLMGRQIASQRNMQEQTPVAYLYGDALLSALPVYKESVCPHVYIYDSGVADLFYLRAFSAPVEYENNKLIVSGNYQYCFYKYENGAWVEFETGEGTDFSEYSVPSADAHVTWTNHDIQRSDGSGVYLAASNPEPLYEARYETLFDGEVTTIDTGYVYYITGDIPPIDFGDSNISQWYALTVDGVRQLFPLRDYGGHNGIGNEHLFNPSDSDTGTDYQVVLYSDSSCKFYSRTVGTYHAKIEKVVY